MTDPVNKYRSGRKSQSRPHYPDEQCGSRPPDFRKLVHHDRLYHVLGELATDSAQAPGPDGVRPGELSRAEWGEHARFLEDLSKSGHYLPGETREVEIEGRTICVPNTLDRALASRLATALGRWIDPQMCETSYAWRPGRDGLMLLARLANLVDEGSTIFLGDDIRKMFDQVDIGRAVAAVQHHFGSVPMLTTILAEQLRGHPTERGLLSVRQGCALSPLVMNLLCDALLEPLSRECPEVNVLRFGDDFAFVGQTSDAVTAARDRIGELVAEAGFELKREQPEPVDLARLNGPRPMLLGLSLAIEAGRFVLGIPQDAWSNLATGLADAGLSDDPVARHEAVAAGWAGAYAAAVIDPDAFLRKIRRTARRVGVRELDLASTKRGLAAGKARWQRLLEEDRESRSPSRESGSAMPGMA